MKNIYKNKPQITKKTNSNDISGKIQTVQPFLNKLKKS